MRKRIICLCLLLALLWGCGENGEKAFSLWQSAAEEAEFRFDAELFALTGDEEWRFAADVRSDPEETVLTLTAPAMIEGITLRCGKEERLEYDGAVLVLPGVTEKGLSPAAVLPLCCRTLRRGRLLRWGRSGEGFLYTLCAGEGLELDVRTDAALAPLSAELRDNGRTAAICTLRGFTLIPAAEEEPGTANDE